MQETTRGVDGARRQAQDAPPTLATRHWRRRRGGEGRGGDGPSIRRHRPVRLGAESTSTACAMVCTGSRWASRLGAPLHHAAFAAAGKAAMDSSSGSGPRAAAVLRTKRGRRVSVYAYPIGSRRAVLSVGRRRPGVSPLRAVRQGDSTSTSIRSRIPACDRASLRACACVSAVCAVTVRASPRRASCVGLVRPNKAMHVRPAAKPQCWRKGYCGRSARCTAVGAVKRVGYAGPPVARHSSTAGRAARTAGGKGWDNNSSAWATRAASRRAAFSAPWAIYAACVSTPAYEACSAQKSAYSWAVGPKGALASLSRVAQRRLAAVLNASADVAVGPWHTSV